MKYCKYCVAPIEDGVNECPACHKRLDAEAPLHQLAPGTILNGRYYVGAALGEGGFGITYIGRDLNLDMKVAIKEYFPTGYVNRSNTVSAALTCGTQGERKEYFEQGRERFLKEARTLAKFSGTEGIVDVRDFFDANNTAYIVMEYLDGLTLKDMLKQNGVMSAGHVVNLLMPIMRALKQVHDQDLIHRDISPDNIMFVDGRIKLLDFGAARNVSAVANKSLSVVLKPGYAPEEQYRTKGSQGPWTDIYALCATMYKCITGSAPEDSTERLVNDTLRRPSEMGIAIDPQIENTIMKGLAVNAKDRFQNITELIAAFEGRIAVTAPVNAAGTMPVQPAGFTPAQAPVQPQMNAAAPAKKSKTGLIIGIAVGVVILILGIILAVVMLGSGGGSETPDTGDSETPTQEATTAAPLTELSDDLYDATFELEGKVYQFPFDCSTLVADGWYFDDYVVDETTLIPGESTESVYMGYGGNDVVFIFCNPYADARAAEECLIAGISIDDTCEVDFKLGKDISLTSTENDITAAFGAFNDSYDGDKYRSIKYNAETSTEYFYVTFTFVTGEGMSYSTKIEMMNFVDDEKYNTETDNTAPAYLSDYVAPTELGTDIVSGVFELDGVVYQMPCPVSEFINNGWTLDFDEEYAPGLNKMLGELTKGDLSVDIEIVNFSEKKTTLENCAVMDITVSDYDEVSIVLPGNVTFGTTKDVLAATGKDDCTDNTFSYYEGDVNYYIAIDSVTGTVDYISLDAEEWTW